ncbi:MAG: RsmE family RNA methyltransferase [Candidatus Omnitrophota bacterium]|jgi:16S rRNA (uracil1498-N3)-methyltransferase
MNRFFISRPVISGNIITMEDREQVHHLKSVLHLKEKERVMIFDQSGNEYSCLISGLGEKIVLEIKERRIPDKSNAKAAFVVACAIPKKSKFDDIVDKLTQLGVDRVIPLVTERVVVKFDRKKEGLRLGRWRKIAQSAAEQSQRRDIPVIEPVQKIKDIFARSKDFDLKLIPTLVGRRKTLRDVFSSPDSLPFSNILVLIGPEGDFSDEEINLSKDAGFIPLTLGDLVLRVDTAAMAVASFIRIYAHD